MFLSVNQDKNMRLFYQDISIEVKYVVSLTKMTLSSSSKRKKTVYFANIQSYFFFEYFRKWETY